jgi:hypothetical protein
LGNEEEDILDGLFHKDPKSFATQLKRKKGTINYTTLDSQD